MLKCVCDAISGVGGIIMEHVPSSGPGGAFERVGDTRRHFKCVNPFRYDSPKNLGRGEGLLDRIADGHLLIHPPNLL